MAGAGFKTFGVGDVLTASDVNTYLMQQAVMVFADSSARDTALGTATGGGNALSTGMLSYRADGTAIEVYDGSEWASVAGLEIGTATPVNGSVLQYGTATAEYAPTAGPFPVAIEAGQSSVTVGANTFGDVTITFTASRFSSAPTVVVNANAANAADASAYTLSGSTSSSGCTIRVRNSDGAARAFSPSYIAVEF